MQRSDDQLRQLLEAWRNHRVSADVHFALSPDQRDALIQSDLPTEEERDALRAEAAEMQPSAAAGPLPLTETETAYARERGLIGDDPAEPEPRGFFDRLRAVFRGR